MQGKFRLSVIYNVGHYMQEDDFKTTAQQFHDFVHVFRIPISIMETGQLKELGVGFFNSGIMEYKGGVKLSFA